MGVVVVVVVTRVGLVCNGQFNFQSRVYTHPTDTRPQRPQHFLVYAGKMQSRFNKSLKSGWRTNHKPIGKGNEKKLVKDCASRFDQKKKKKKKKM